MTDKRCSRCEQTKPLSEFSRNKARPDGYSVWCLDCYKWSRQRMTTIDLKIGRNLDRHSVITAPMPVRTDESWEKVCKAMAYWMGDKTLKPSQVDVIMMRTIEHLDWPEISDMAGLTKDSVIYHYRQGIKRLQARYEELVKV